MDKTDQIIRGYKKQDLLKSNIYYTLTQFCLDVDSSILLMITAWILDMLEDERNSSIDSFNETLETGKVKY